MQAFRRYLLGLIGQFVQVGRVGPDTSHGWLLAVQTDYLTLQDSEGYEMHRPLHHIRSVMPLPVEYVPPHAPATPGQPSHFLALLQAHSGQRGQINHGPEAWVGTLLACTEDHLVLELTPGEACCLPLFHVRSFTPLRAGQDAPRAVGYQEAGDPCGDVAPGAGCLLDHRGADPMASGGHT